MKTRKRKRILLAALLVTVASCGGGGGGGSSSSATTPTTTTTVTSTSAYDSLGNIIWRDSSRTYNSSDPHNKSSVTAYTGSGVEVGIIDLGYNTTNAGLRADISSKFDSSRYNHISTSNEVTTENHGILVAEMVGGNTSNGIAKKVTLNVVDAAKKGSDNDIVVEPTRAMYDALESAGSTIYNQSFGGDVVSDYTSSTYAGAIGSNILSFYKTGVSKGYLFVWAAGNESSDTQPSLEAALPYFDSSLEAGWINVVGLTKKDSNGDLSWSNLTPYSPAGVAANWTVSAIADHMVTLTDTSDSTKKANWSISGSSFAAPVVTGTATLIKEKYPWMDGSLLRQTILSTATDIGAEGVDDKFGWGLLDIGKAINGPSQFLKTLALADNVTVNVTTGVYTFSIYREMQEL